MRELLPLALAIAAVSFTLSKSTMPLVRWAREWVSERSGVIRELLHCPYCVSNWIAVGVMVAYQPTGWVASGHPILDWIVCWQALVGAAMAPIFALMFLVRVSDSN